jgi:hypothetical protein
MVDFLTFKSFISIDVLILFYYIGAVLVPVFLLITKRQLQKKFLVLEKSNDIFKGIFKTLSLKSKIKFIILMVFIFLFMELFWRMGFEMMIGYFQMVQSLKGA